MPGSVEEWMEIILERDTAKKLASELTIMLASEVAKVNILQSNEENIQADNITLKKHAEKLARELQIQRGRKKDHQKEIIELQLVIKTNNSVMGDLRETCSAMGNLVNTHKEQIFELTANLSAAQLADKSKLRYIDEHMKPLKDDAQTKHNMARRSETILEQLFERIAESPDNWSMTSLSMLLARVITEVDDAQK